MFCQIKTIASIEDVVSVRNRLINEARREFKHLAPDELPLQNCHVALSPSADILVLAWDIRMVVLAVQWDYDRKSQSSDQNDAKHKFSLLWSGKTITKQHHQGEYITSIMCLPMRVSPGKSATIDTQGADWTCVALGYSTGYVRFFTETGELLTEEMFHRESVLHIKNGQREEINIFYQTYVCVVQGFSLSSALVAFRNNLARVKANCGKKPQIPNIIYKKWSLKNQDHINDCDIINPHFVTTFDHLVKTSQTGGYNANYKMNAPKYTLILATGKRPYVGFYYAQEDNSNTILSDVAMAMANKVAGWLRSSSKSDQGSTATSDTTDVATCKFGLCDVMREGDTILLSPNKLLSAVCDTMGRVILVDNQKGLAVRFWKGYRDAQCAWIEAVEEPGKKSHRNPEKRSALFLVIYAPRKGIIDVWSAQYGGKITTFAASKNGKLLNNLQNLCVFIDSNGQLKEIVVPFYLALNNYYGNKIKDMNLLKRFKNFLKRHEFSDSADSMANEITNMCLNLKTTEVQTLAINTLMTSKHISPEELRVGVECFLKPFQTLDTDGMELQAKVFHKTVIQLQGAIDFYKEIVISEEFEDILEEDKGDNENLATLLFMPEKEISRIMEIIERIKCLRKTKEVACVSFKEDRHTFTEFLSCFEFGTKEFLNFHPELSLDKKVRISKLMFRGPLERWKQAAEISKIHPAVLMDFALHSWLSFGGKTLTNFTKLLETICRLADVEEVCASNWWRDVREILLNSQCPSRALTAGLACRAVAMAIQKSKDSSAVDWEIVNEDICQFSVLLSNLEDVALLEAVVSRPPATDFTNRFHSLPHEDIPISLALVLSKGKGSVSEIVARWLSGSGLEPAQLIDPTDVEFEQSTSAQVAVGQEAIEDSVVVVDKSTSKSQVDEKLSILKKSFPYSLTSSVLLANLSWEFVMYWNEDIKRLEALDAAVSIIPHIPSKRIRHGVCCLLWSLHIRRRMEAASKLINKLGKLPKTILCEQDLGLSNDQLAVFLQHCTTFLSCFLDAEVLEEENCWFIKSEQLWEGHVGHGPLPFASLAVSQNPASYDLIILHYQLSNVLHMIAQFNIRLQKPINSLFDSNAQQYFFQDISSKNTVPWYADKKRDETRFEFLCRVISASVETIHQETASTKDRFSCYSSTEAILWMSKCQNQACMWKINIDELRIHQVVQFYMNGFDQLADEVLMAVNDTKKLGLCLLPVAGCRISMFLNKSDNMLGQLSTLDPLLTAYLQGLKIDNTDRSLTNVSIDDTKELVLKIMRCIPESDSDYQKAQLMLDAVSMFKDSISAFHERL